MGADNNPSSTSKLISLQSRKQALEEKITVRNQELRRLCIQEAELTGIMPPEIPLEPGEPIPTFRRRVGTAFEYPQNIINKLCNEEKTISTLETQIQVQKRIGEAALRLASDSTISKSVKRKNMTLYQRTKQQLSMMEERLESLKSQGNSVDISNCQTQQRKQRKKPRPRIESENVSNKSNYNSQTENQTSNRTIHQPLDKPDGEIEHYILNKYNMVCQTSAPCMLEENSQITNNGNFNNNVDGLAFALDRLTINSYSGTKERRGSESSSNSSYLQTSFTLSYSNPNIYQPHQMVMPNSPTLSLVPDGSTATQYQSQVVVSPSNLNFPAHTLPTTKTRSHVDDSTNKKYGTNQYKNNYYQDSYPHYSYSPFPIQVSSPNYKQFVYDESNNFANVANGHNQKYQQEVIPATGLGGQWIKTDNGEMVWCANISYEDVSNTWQTDKRFGSLDRRRGKCITHKRTSPCLDGMCKQSTIKFFPHPQEINRHIVQTAQSPSRNGRQDNQLVRTQSLGSVGAHTVDSVWPSDDNLSYDSDGHSISEQNTALRKLKQKGWCETSLDGPAIDVVQTFTANEKQHTPTQMSVLPHSSPMSRTSKVLLEIPAESNPSPAHLDTNVNIYNNTVISDLPKNCTIVQAGQCKPYREVTKPFEMSDFYKYSTKFREKNQEKLWKHNSQGPRNQDFAWNSSPQAIVQSKCETHIEQDETFQKGAYQTLQPAKYQTFSPPININRNFANANSHGLENSVLDTSLTLNTSNVAENFSAEMNAWYQSRGQSTLDSSSQQSNRAMLGKSAATLV